MPAPSKYPAPHEQLTVLAREARRDGITFERFWDLAMRPGQPAITWFTPEEKRPPRCVVWPYDSVDRKLSVRATQEAKEGWRRAYEGAPPSGPEKALRLLAPLLEKMDVELESGASYVPMSLPPEQLSLDAA